QNHTPIITNVLGLVPSYPLFPTSFPRPLPTCFPSPAWPRRLAPPLGPAASQTQPRRSAPAPPPPLRRPLGARPRSAPPPLRRLRPAAPAPLRRPLGTNPTFQDSWRRRQQ